MIATSNLATADAVASMRASRDLAAEILERSLHGPTWPEREIEELASRAAGADPVQAAEATKAVFRDVVEPLCDSFDAQATEAYARLFAAIVECVLPQYTAHELLHRYRRVRQVRRYKGTPAKVYVLSRVTLGADVAVTSAVIAAARERFPEATIYFAGPAKNAALFAGIPAVRCASWAYERSGSLRDRLLASASLATLPCDEDTLVIDPDSRLSQLAMIPVCAEHRYLFFESRTYGGNSHEPLPVLTGRWLAETLGVSGRPHIAPERNPRLADITVSLGVGGNDDKAGGPDFELRVMAKLASLGRRVLVDRGAGAEEGARVDRLIEALGNPANVSIHDGSFASFATQIMQSELYFGYDSAGQHVAAASGVPLVCFFAGYASDRTFDRWRPCGTGPMRVVKATASNRQQACNETVAAIESLAARIWPA